MLGTIPSHGCQLSLLQTFWYQNELYKSIGYRDRILPKYGHGRGHFLTIRQFLKFSMPAKYLCYDVLLLFQVKLALINRVHTQFGPAPRVYACYQCQKSFFETLSLLLPHACVHA